MLREMTSDRRSSKSLDPDQAEHVRVRLLALIEEAGSQVEVARRLGVTQQSVSQVVGGRSQPGVVLAARLATMLRITLDDLLTGRSAVSGRRENTVHHDATRPTLDRIEGYAAAEAAARAIAPRIPDAAWARVRAMSGADVRVVDAESVLGFARTWERVLAGQVQPYPDDGEVPPPPRKR